MAIIILLFAHISYGQNIHDYKFPNDYRGVIHLHSELSRDSDGKFKDIVEAGKNNQIDFIVMTDHWSSELYDKSKRGFVESILFIAGAEISKNEGVTLIALPLPRDFVPEDNWRNNIISLRQKGALALANHIEFSETAQLTGSDGIEITNLHSILVGRSYPGFFLAWLQALWPPNWNLGYLIDDVPNIKRWHYLDQLVTMPAFAGNDTHDNYRLFYKIGPKLGSYDNTFKLITTHIWANELSEKSVIEAVKNGQSYFAFEIFGNSKGFRFYAINNENVYLPGNIISQTREKETKNQKTILTIQAPPHANPRDTTLRILKNGKAIKEGGGILLIEEISEPGVYYAEIWKNQKPWIFSNPIKILEK